MAFRLALMYTGVFTISLNIVYWIFYVMVLYGSHGLTKQELAMIRHDFRELFAWPLLVIIVFSALIGWFMARRALAGVVQLTRTAGAVAEGALNERVPTKGDQDEIDQLALTFNMMLERIEALIANMKGTNDNIAHDLRSPVARMRGMAESRLTDETSSRDVVDLAAYVVEECDRLLGMINAMLDISEAEAGVMKLNVERVDLAFLLRDALELFRPLAESKDIRLLIDAPEILYVRTDKRKLQRVVANLLDNAVKFSHCHGSIDLTLSLEGDHVLITVRDDGIGISEEDLPHIFERFFRGEKSRTEPGNGLGLSLAKAFVTSLGGTIRVVSTYGKGSTFTVRLLPELAVD